MTFDATGRRFTPGDTGAIPGPVTGTISFLDAAFLPGATLTAAQIPSFAVTSGGITWTAVGASFVVADVSVNAAGTGFGDWGLSLEQELVGGNTGPEQLNIINGNLFDYMGDEIVYGDSIPGDRFAAPELVASSTVAGSFGEARARRERFSLEVNERSIRLAAKGRSAMARRVGSQGERTEAAIRGAALRLIARHGYEALSMRRLAEEVGLGAAALYRYFPNKQAILMGLLEAHMRELLEAWAAARLPASRPAPERLEAFTRFHIRHHLPRADGVFLSYMELRSLTRENFERIEGLRRAYEAALVEILEAGRRDGSLSAPAPKVAARAIIAMLTGITTWYRAGGPLSASELEEIYWRLVAGSVGLAPAPAPDTPKEDTPCSTPA